MKFLVKRTQRRWFYHECLRISAEQRPFSEGNTA